MHVSKSSNARLLHWQDSLTAGIIKDLISLSTPSILQDLQAFFCFFFFNFIRLIKVAVMKSHELTMICQYEHSKVQE